jgi:molecular chaperone DnaK
LTVKAKEKTTGKEQSIRIEGSTGLSKDDIEKMKADAAAHEAEDKKRAELVEARNTADQAVYAAEKAIKDNGEKAGAEVVKEVQDKIEAVKTAQKSEDAGTIKTATENLSQSLMKIGEAMMKAQENQTPPPADGGQTPPPEAGATDAEFKEKPE